MPKAPNLAKLAKLNGRYGVAALDAVGCGMRSAAALFEKTAKTGVERHLTAAQLVEGVAEHAAEQYGLLGDLVLAECGIRSGEDVGAITFFLIEQGVFSKQPDDRPEDFLTGPELRVAVTAAVRRRLGV